MSLLDIYDEEFIKYLDLAQVLIAQLKSRDDRQICTKWIKKLFTLKTKDISVKRNRNAFFKYMLEILHQGSGMEENIKIDTMFQKPFLQKKDPGFMSRWSEDKKTYVAAKPLPGRGTLVYMAVAKDPTMGWEYSNK